MLAGIVLGTGSGAPPAGAAEPDSQAAARAVQAAQRLVEAGEWARAKRVARQLEDHAEASIRWRAGFVLALAYRAQGREREAVRRWTALSEAVDRGDPLWPELQFTRGDHLVASDEQDAALERFRAAVPEALALPVRVPALVARADRMVALPRLELAHVELAIDDLRSALRMLEAEYSGDIPGHFDVAGIRSRLAEARRLAEELEHGADGALYERARLAYRHARYRQAAELFAQLIERYPESEHVPPSHYRYGLVRMQQGRLTAAVEAWSAFVAASPTGPWRGQAYVAIGDLSLEHFFDIDTARAAFERAFAILVDQEAELDESWEQAASDIYQRMGVLAYFDRERARSLELFTRAAESYVAPEDPDSGVAARELGRLREIIEGGGELTPLDADGRDDRVRLIILMGDMYYESRDLERAAALYENILDHGGTLRPSEAQQAWVSYRWGRLQAFQFDIDTALEHYAAVVERMPEASWADDALMRMAIAYYTSHRDAERAKQTLERIVADYPKGDKAEKAAYYSAVVSEWSGDHAAALRDYRKLFSRYPDTVYRQAVETRHLPVVRAALRAQAQGDQP